jgi:hypothetical protein
MLKEEEEEEAEWFKSCHYLSQLVFKTIPNLFSLPPKYNLGINGQLYCPTIIF